MKKTLLLLIVGILFSCSDDDNGHNFNNADDSILPTKLITLDSNGDTLSKLFYTYEGNKIKEIYNVYYFGSEEFVLKSNYEYSGDYITKQTTLSEPFKSLRIENYSYENNKLSSIFVKMIAEGEEREYEEKFNWINSNHLKTTLKFLSDSIEDSSTSEYFYKNGNLIKIKESYGIETFTYDNRPNPHRNIVGMQYLGYNNSFFSKNNLTNENSGDNSRNYSYEYTTHNYPSKHQCVYFYTGNIDSRNNAGFYTYNK